MVSQRVMRTLLIVVVLVGLTFIPLILYGEAGWRDALTRVNAAIAEASDLGMSAPADLARHRENVTLAAQPEEWGGVGQEGDSAQPVGGGEAPKEEQPPAIQPLIEVPRNLTEDEQRAVASREHTVPRMRAPWAYRNLSMLEYPGPSQIHGAAAAAGERKVAYAITVLGEINAGALDMAAVLAQSVREAVGEEGTHFTRYELVAIVGGTATWDKSGRALQQLGYRVLLKHVPVRVDDIQEGYLKQHIGKDGCCGERELLKLHAFTLTEYYRVVALDMDVMLLRNLDHLLAMDKELIFTIDINMASGGTSVPPYQGGFFVIKPSIDAYKALVRIVLKGNYKEGGGWGGLNVGWNYGGKTIQGLFAYYYGKIAKEDLSYEADRCVYNAMFDRDECKPVGVGFGGPDGRGARSVHFTVCQKPITCVVPSKCRAAHERWQELRAQIAKAKGWPDTKACDNGYKPLPFPPALLSGEQKAEEAAKPEPIKEEPAREAANSSEAGAEAAATGGDGQAPAIQPLIEVPRNLTEDEQRAVASREHTVPRMRAPWAYRNLSMLEYPGPSQIHGAAAAAGERKVAYAITVLGEINAGALDMAAVLAQSVREAVGEEGTHFTRYELVAIVGGTATWDKSGRALQQLGYRVLLKHVPVRVDDIQEGYLKQHIGKDGCCGERELLKLHAFTLTEYYRVVALDMDVMLLRNLDHLLAMDKELIFTIDINMASGGTSVPPYQGGFFVIKPSIDAYKALVRIVLKGNYKEGGGWGGLNVGWSYGGKTIQGLFAYYYGKIAKEDLSYEADRCVYNAMFDRDECKPVGVGFGGPDGRGVRSVHFTVCQKPITCVVLSKCRAAHERWQEFRAQIAKAKGWNETKACDNGYKPLPFPSLVQR